MRPTTYEVATIGAGKLSVMAKPVGGDWANKEFTGLRQLSIDHVVSLLEAIEQAEVGLTEEESLCNKHGMRYTSFPIIDREVPEKKSALDLAAALHQDLLSGEHIVIHCRAGVGRTGVIASVLLILAGYSSAEALHLVSFARGVLVPDTDEQDRWVRSIQV
jgi:protein-tyrosine phosphatase